MFVHAKTCKGLSRLCCCSVTTNGEAGLDSEVVCMTEAVHTFYLERSHLRTPEAVLGHGFFFLVRNIFPTRSASIDTRDL